MSIPRRIRSTPEPGGVLLALILFAILAAAAACGESVLSPQTSGGTTPPPPPSAPVVAVRVLPDSAAVQPGAAVDYSVTGYMEDGTSGAVAVAWSSTGGTVDGDGHYVADANAGVYRVIARHTLTGLADTSLVRVSGTPPAPTLVDVEIAPPAVALATGGTQQFAATGRMSDGSTTSVSIAWSSTGGTISATGLYTAGATGGLYQVVATHAASGLADTAAVTINVPAPTLVGVTVTPASASLQTGATQQFAASGQMSDGSSSAVTVAWSATGGTISGSGLYTAGTSAGSYRVIATHAASGLADTATVTVSQQAPTLVGVAVTPASASLQTGATQQFVASGQMSDGSSSAVTVAWSATGGTISGSGQYTAGTSAGSYRVVATHAASGLADTATISLSAPAATVVAVYVTPNSASLVGGTAQSFSATATMSDGSTGSVTVSWSATAGTITSSGFYTAPSAAGTYEVIGRHTASGHADTSTVSVSAPPSGSFPQQYSVTRPLLANNPGALINGEDWQRFGSTADLVGTGFHMGSGPTAHDAASTPVVNGPAGARRAEIVTDPVFGRAVRVWATDGSDGWEHTVRYSRVGGGYEKVWYRVLMKFENGFTDGNCVGSYTGGRSHKLIFGGYQRHIQTIDDQWNIMAGPDSPWPGKTETLLPGSPAHGGKWLYGYEDGGPVYSDEEWYEFIAFEERLSATHYRIRSWLRRVSTNDVIENSPVQVVRRNGDAAKFGLEITASSIPAGGSGGLQMGINRNCPLTGGDTLWWMWGPYEVIDASLVPDPYGLANDML